MKAIVFLTVLVILAVSLADAKRRCWCRIKSPTLGHYQLRDLGEVDKCGFLCGCRRIKQICPNACENAVRKFFDVLGDNKAKYLLCKDIESKVPINACKSSVYQGFYVASNCRSTYLNSPKGTFCCGRAYIPSAGFVYGYFPNCDKTKMIVGSTVYTSMVFSTC